MDSEVKQICFLGNEFKESTGLFHADHISLSFFDIQQADEIFCKDVSAQYDYCLIDGDFIDNGNLEKILGYFIECCHVIYMSDIISDETGKILLQQGVVDAISRCAVCDIVSYVKSLELKQVVSTGKILILEDDAKRKRAIDAIVSRFGYKAEYAMTSDEMQQCVSRSNVQFILLNLGIDFRELNDFVRTYCTRVEMRRIPVISYKDLSDGIFIHEIVKGLNKLTKVILSSEELYSFLVEVLFKKDFLPLLDSLNVSLSFNDCSYYARESLKRIYYLNEGNIFHSDNVLQTENVKTMYGMLNLMQQSLIRVSGLKWLYKEMDHSLASTCEGGV